MSRLEKGSRALEFQKRLNERGSAFLFEVSEFVLWQYDRVFMRARLRVRDNKELVICTNGSIEDLEGIPIGDHILAAANLVRDALVDPTTVPEGSDRTTVLAMKPGVPEIYSREVSDEG